VEDTGVGICKSEIPHLFEMFKVIKKHKQAFNIKGTGLGLPITKKLVDSLGGTIFIESEEEGGTSIEFTVLESIKPNREGKIS